MCELFPHWLAISGIKAWHRTMLFKLEEAIQSPEELVEIQILIQVVGDVSWGFACDVDAAGPWTSLQGSRTERMQRTNPDIDLWEGYFVIWMMPTRIMEICCAITLNPHPGIKNDKGRQKLRLYPHCKCSHHVFPAQPISYHHNNCH